MSNNGSHVLNFKRHLYICYRKLYSLKLKKT